MVIVDYDTENLTAYNWNDYGILFQFFFTDQKL